jgi:transcriptional regulator with XRE-family HTH domain
MDYEAVARELVRALRGSRSQAACSRRMKCSSNVFHAWETGVRYPSLSHFDALVRLAGADLSRAFAALGSGASGSPARRPTDRARWLRDLAAGRSVSELARALQRNRNTVARWLDASTEPRLPDLLRFVHATTLRLLEFIGTVVDPARLPSVLQAHRDLEAQRRLAYDMPWSHAVLRAMDLSSYRALRRHEPGFLARQLGIDAELEQACLGALAASGQIRKIKGKWQQVRVLAVDTRVDPGKNWILKRHWAAVAVQRLQLSTPAENSLFSYNLFAITDEAYARIRELHLAYYEQVRAVVEASRGGTRVALVNVQLVPLGHDQSVHDEPTAAAPRKGWST